MRVLVACEESQRVCIAFRKLGHESYSCDLLPCSGGHPEWHIQCDVLQLRERASDYFDLLICHPPCDYLSKAGARWLYGKEYNGFNFERFHKGMLAAEFLMQFLQWNVKYIAVENPVPLKIYGLPNPSCVVQPFQFGDPYSKKTYLWLKNLPVLEQTCLVSDYIPYLPSNTSGFRRGQKSSCGVVHNKIDSSKTFKGIADAMANQWGGVIR